jgi:hypothetical protein
LLYSTRFRRLAVTRPGPLLASECPSDFSIHAVTAATSVFGGTGEPGGGMRPVLNLSSTFSQTVAEPPPCSRLRLAVLTLSLWHAKQFFERKGRTLFRYSAWLVSCAARLQHANSPSSAGRACKFREMASSTPNIHLFVMVTPGRCARSFCSLVKVAYGSPRYRNTRMNFGGFPRR